MIFKKLLLLFCLGIFFIPAKAKGIRQVPDTALLALPVVDKRVELLSIVFRLAGNQEYNDEIFKKYTDDIHKHFDKYKNHPLIAFAKQLADSNGVAYDAVMSMAVDLSQPPELKPLVKFTDKIPDERWTALNAIEFVTLLQKFYKDAHCEEFFEQEKETYKLAAERFRKVFDKLDLSWYKQYYGYMPEGKFTVVVATGNGGGNYGPHVNYPDGKEEVYAIMGTWMVDSTGAPKYSVRTDFPILLHEFNHSFVNAVIEKHAKEFEEYGPTIYKAVADKMDIQKYANWKVMMYEALVRASVIEYFKMHDTTGKQASKQMMEEMENGFVWMKELVALMDIYQNNKQKYPTLESFIPHLAIFYKDVAKRIEALIEGYNEDCKKHGAHVISVDGFKNNALDVNPGLTEIKIKFDKTMDNTGYGINYGDKGKDAYPITDVIGYADNNTSIRLKVALKPDTEYQFVLNGYAFKTADGYSLETYTVNFKTTK